jgi:hypothetical protein
MCAVAFYNRFPLTYPDAGTYLENALAIAHGRAPWIFYRPVIYGAFLVPFATPPTIWLVPLAQGFLTALVVDLALRTASVSLSTRGFLTLVAGLTAFTSLPWISGQLMPDAFTAPLVLLGFVVVWDDGRFSVRERWIVGALTTLAIGCHLSHFPLYAILVVAAITIRLLLDRQLRVRARLVPVVLRAFAPMAAAAALVVGSNYYAHRTPVLSRSSALFALGHLVGDSLAQRYLARACPTQRYLLCSELSSLHANLDWFLWDPEGTWQQYKPRVEHGDSTFLREAPAIVAGTLRQEWPNAIRTALRTTVVQLGTFGARPGDFAYSNTVDKAMARLGPGTLRAYRASRQVEHYLPLEAATRVQYAAVVIGALVVLGYLSMLRGRGNARITGLVATTAVGVAVNALVMASLAMVQPRYQSRVVWLVPLIAGISALQVVRARRGTSVTT